MTVLRVKLKYADDQRFTGERPRPRGAVRVQALIPARGIGRRVVLRAHLEGTGADVRRLVRVAELARRWGRLMNQNFVAGIVVWRSGR